MQIKERCLQQGRSEGQGRGLGIIFAINWLIIGIISAIDCYWSIRLQECLYEHEKNPLGRWLIELDGGSIALFMMCKIIGTTVALGVLFFLFLYKRTWAHIICFSICILQVMLLVYLYYGHTDVS